MRKFALLTTCFLVSSAFSQNIWIKRDSVNGPPRGACASFTVDGEAHVVGGVNVEEFKRKTYSYDLDQNDWDNEASLGGEAGSGLERASAVGFTAANYGFIALGSGAASYMKDVWRYDAVNDTWTQMADFQGTARNGAIAFAIDNIAYVGTGQDEDGLTDDFYKFNPTTNTWTELGSFDGGERKEAVGFTMGGKGYVGTGRGSSTYFKDFWEYDPSEDEWKQLADFPGTPRMGAVGCGVFPSAFVMLGEDNSFEYKKDVWEYNYFGDIWTQRADYMGGTRTQASAMVVDNRIFVGLGYNGIYHDDFYEYEQVLSASEENVQLPLKIYPNPVINNFTVDLPIQLYQPHLKLQGINGQDLSDHISIIAVSGNRIKVSLNNAFSSGLYFVSLFDGDTYIGTKKIQVQ